MVARIRGLDRPERSVLGLVAGMAALSFALGLNAIAGAFRAWTIAAVIVLGLGVLPSVRRRLRAPGDLPVRRAAGVPSFSWIAVAAAAALAVAILLALYPPTAFDDTLYHLPLARGLVEHGGATFQPELRYPAFPLGQEVLMGTVLGLGGSETGVHLVAVAQLALLLAVAGLWARRLAGPRWAAMAPALVAGCPLFVWLGSTAYVDLAVTLYGVSALWAFDLGRAWCRDDRSSIESRGDHGGGNEGGGDGRNGEGGDRQPDLAAWAIAGGLAGAAAGVKYNGLFFVAALACAGWLATRRGLRRAALFRLVLVALVAGAPWYLRNAIATGNPVFPFATAIFGESAWKLPPQALANPHGWTLAEPLALGGLWRSLGWLTIDLARSPFLLVRDSFQPAGVPPLSPFAAVALPVAALLAIGSARTRALAVIAFIYLALWLLNLREARYLAPVVPIAAVLAAALAAALAARRQPAAPAGGRDLWRRILAGCALVVVVAPSWAFAARHAILRGPPPLRPEARSGYLDRWLPGHAVLACAPPRPGAPVIYGLGAEALRYYAPGRYLGDWSTPYRYARVEPLLGDPERLAAELRDMGAELLLAPAGRVERDDSVSLRLLASCQGFELWEIPLGATVVSRRRPRSARSCSRSTPRAGVFPRRARCGGCA